MKKLFTLLVAILLTASVFAQSPQKMSYQAVIRNSSNELVKSKAIGMRISILQGSATGKTVYTETKTTNSNANGLVSIEIGEGAGFNTIDWANGPYFIKTETDPTGGTNYNITITSQLLSVPYALHAKTAENLTHGITETDPVFKAWKKDYNDLINKPSIADSISLHVNGSETKIKSGYGIILNGDGTTVSPYVVSTPLPVELTRLSIGDSYQGGIIFWLDASREHGLIAATADQSTKMIWSSETNTNTNALADGINAGKSNTDIIIANQVSGDGSTYAARVCHEYSGSNYGDWYLPSKYELNLLYLQKSVVGGLVSNYYWSSSEFNNSSAFVYSFADGSQTISKKNNTNYVRAVRAF